VWIAQKHIGGSDDLQKAHQNGTLEKLLAESSSNI
jgi:glutaredoxin-related protein